MLAMHEFRERLIFVGEIFVVLSQTTKLPAKDSVYDNSLTPDIFRPFHENVLPFRTCFTLLGSYYRDNVQYGIKINVSGKI